MDISYIINELGEERENYFNAIAPPIIQTSNFKFNTVEDFRHALANEHNGHLYSRGFNPTSDILRKKLAALDGAEDALVFGSGIAAITIPIIALLKQGNIRKRIHEYWCIHRTTERMAFATRFKNFTHSLGANYCERQSSN